MKKVLSLIFILLLAMFSCTKKNGDRIDASTFASVRIDSTIKKDEVFRSLEQQNDIDMSSEGIRKKTSGALFYSKRKDELEIPSYFSANNCRAEIVDDTLIIRIGTTTGLSDYGMKIKYINGKFLALPYQSMDIVIPKTFEKKLSQQDFFTRARKLVLDKYNYKVGDSVFGRIHAEIEKPNEKDSQNNDLTIEYVADGYFRAKIEKL